MAAVARLQWMWRWRLRAALCLPRGSPGLILGNPVSLRRGLSVSVLSYLAYEFYRKFCSDAVVYANDNVIRDQVLDKADYLYEAGETEKLYHFLQEYKQSDNVEILWRLARALRDLAMLSTTRAEDKKRLIYEALDYAQKALSIDAEHFAVHKWYAICISDVGDYEGTNTKIADSYVIKGHLQKAIELNPYDATSYHLMGLWCWSFASLSWFQRKMGAILFSTPPTSTYEEALQYFLKAEQGTEGSY
ncbi:regulator of microtubule dynamics protein 1 isoform X2 [Microcaecilia unicolor]|uniref:Regulator of microtubule dynamics protein 1 n=1 Tax=Microcaecilia unicolor TaxID=1415580 RepID=A0A6P7YY77_9AMPH|nr:regulator of microtubule dynamics protein 1 isoform X2 [Microcaecilia unicolor]